MGADDRDDREDDEESDVDTEADEAIESDASEEPELICFNQQHNTITYFYADGTVNRMTVEPAGMTDRMIDLLVDELRKGIGNVSEIDIVRRNGDGENLNAVEVIDDDRVATGADGLDDCDREYTAEETLADDSEGDELAIETGKGMGDGL